jgi:GntR family transcriptional repressor for pyruvate dehydrogenase complex
MGRSRQTVVPTDRSTRVIDYIRSLIQAGTLRAGDRIPSEIELARAAGVTRSHVRAGIACLRSLGVVRSRSGSRAVLGADPPQLPVHLFAAFHPFEPEEVREAHSLVVSHLAALAAQKATQDDHTVLAEEVAEMYAARTPLDHRAHALRFQRRIGVSAGNSPLAAFAEALTKVASANDPTSLDKSDLQESARLHGEIYRAIRRRQPQKASRATEEQFRAAAISRARAPRMSEDEEGQRSLAG